MSESPIPAPKPARTFSALLQRKIFGVPAMVFVMLAAAVILYFALKMKSVPDIDSGPREDSDFEGDEGRAAGTPIFRTIRVPLNQQDDLEPDELTRQEWATRSIQWLIGQGNSVQKSTAAINKYLGRSPLSMEERTLVDAALVQFGPPPGGFLSVPNAPNPNAPPIKQGNPPTRHTVKGNQDNNPLELTRLYYNRTDDETRRYLVANNPELETPYKTGDKVKIPVYKAPKYYTATASIDTAAEIAQKNGTSAAMVKALNPGMQFPVEAGTRVRVQ